MLLLSSDRNAGGVCKSDSGIKNVTGLLRFCTISRVYIEGWFEHTAVKQRCVSVLLECDATEMQDKVPTPTVARGTELGIALRLKLRRKGLDRME